MRFAAENRTCTHRTTSSGTGTHSSLIPARVEEEELLDQDIGTMADVRANLEEMWRINVLFGGLRSLTCHLHPLLRASAESLTVVDVGTGSGRLPIHLFHWAKRHQIHLHTYALDLSGRNLAVAQANLKSHSTIHSIQADGQALPFMPNSIDYFVSSLLLHHLSPEPLIQFLRSSFRLARRGIVMNDIVRGYLPLAAFRLIQPIFARHYLTRHDGIVSIKRAYTVSELRELAQAAGIENARVYGHFPWRMTLVAEKPHV